jgi:hypothetical protein
VVVAVVAVVVVVADNLVVVRMHRVAEQVALVVADNLVVVPQCPGAY